ncbi:MAG: substrate-binding domain-containing protein [Candidatus Dormibacteria bacterium]
MPKGHRDQTPAPGAGRRLRLSRLAAGLSQSELAASAGVSRQAIAGMEGDSWSPSLSVAMRLAEALRTTVEQLFAPASAPLMVSANPLGPHAEGPVRAQLAQVFGRWVALPLERDDATQQGFRVATGEIGQSGTTHWSATGERSIVVAGCDPALPLLAGALPAGPSPWQLCWWSCGSRAALTLLQEGLVHAAAVHGADRSTLPTKERFARIGFASWAEGVLTAPGPPGTPARLEELVADGMRLVNRESGAEARSLLDRELRRLAIPEAAVTGYRSQVSSHMAVAGAIASGLADFGIATEPVALAFGLSFQPLTHEDCVILVSRAHLESPELAVLLSSLGTGELNRQLGSLPGYSLELLGDEV